MDQNKLIALLHQQETEISERTPFCPGDNEIAAYFDHKSPHHDNELSEQHLVNCGYCLARITVLAQLHKSDDDEQIPESLFALAGQFGHQPRRRFRYASAWATAAAVVFATLMTFSWGPSINQIPVSTSGGTPDSREYRQLRSMDEDALRPRLLSPMEGEGVDPVDLTIQWTEVPGSLYYDLYVMTDTGDLLVETRLTDSNWNGQPTDPLLPGKEYFVRVDAYFADSRSVSSEHVSFKVTDQD